MCSEVLGLVVYDEGFRLAVYGDCLGLAVCGQS